MSHLKAFAQRFAQTWFLLELLRGLRVTAGYLGKRKFTVQYPEERTPQSPRFRGLHALRRYPNGEERCIACKPCDSVCLALGFTTESDKRPAETGAPTRYD